MICATSIPVISSDWDYCNTATDFLGARTCVQPCCARVNVLGVFSVAGDNEMNVFWVVSVSVSGKMTRRRRQVEQKTRRPVDLKV